MTVTREKQALIHYLLHLQGEPALNAELVEMGKNFLELRWAEIEENLGEIKRWADRGVLREIWLSFFEPVVIKFESDNLSKSFLVFLLNNTLARDFLTEHCHENIFEVIESQLRLLS